MDSISKLNHLSVDCCTITEISGIVCPTIQCYTQWLFTFLYIIFSSLCMLSSTPFLLAVCTFSPTSIYVAWRFMKVDEEEFIQYIVYPKCDSIYKLEDCIIRSETQLMSQHCSHVAFRNHPQQRYGLPCSTIIHKTVTLKGGKKS